jgi:hypothetical protein
MANEIEVLAELHAKTQKEAQTIIATYEQLRSQLAQSNNRNQDLQSQVARAGIVVKAHTEAAECVRMAQELQRRMWDPDKIPRSADLISASLKALLAAVGALPVPLPTREEYAASQRGMQ